MHIQYRPTTWEEIVGNDHIKNSIKSYKFDVPVMFVGERGCGKTTMTGILVRNFGVPEGNIKYVNCGTDRKIDNSRKLVDYIHSSTIFGSKKAIILDEIHKLLSDSQDVWLTELENLPKDVLVFACTTDPHKIIPTLYDRFVVYEVFPLNTEKSVDLINRICYKEGIELLDWVKNLIAVQTNGNPRNILRAISVVRGVEDEVQIKNLIKTSIENNVEKESIDLFKLLYSNNTDWKLVSNLLKKLLKEHSPDVIRSDLMNIISGTIMYQKDVSNDLIHMYEVLKNADGYLEKAELILAIAKIFKGEY